MEDPNEKRQDSDGGEAAQSPSSPADKDGHFTKRFGNILRGSKRNKRVDSTGSLPDKNQNESTISLEDKPKSPKPMSRQRKLSNMFKRSKSNKSQVSAEEDGAPPSPTKDNPNKGMNDSENGIEPSMQQRRMSHTRYSESRSIVVGGKATREVEVTGEKPEQEDKKPKKATKKKSGEELSIPCRDLGDCDCDGWLHKKGGGFGAWKKLWCALKDGTLYVYKTSFDVVALNVIKLNQYDVVLLPDDKRKFAFRCHPKQAAFADGASIKPHSFSGDTQESAAQWVETLKKASEGITIAKPSLGTPDLDRRRLYSAAKKQGKEPSSPEDVNRNSRRVSTTAFAPDSETTGLPSSFERQGSVSGRPRKLSTSNKTSVLAVGSMFHSIESPDDESPSTENATLTDLLYTKKEIIVVENSAQSPEEEKEINDLKKDIKKDMEFLQQTTDETAVTIESQQKPVETTLEAAVTTESQQKPVDTTLETDVTTESQQKPVDTTLETTDTTVSEHKPVDPAEKTVSVAESEPKPVDTTEKTNVIVSEPQPVESVAEPSGKEESSTTSSEETRADSRQDTPVVIQAEASPIAIEALPSTEITECDKVVDEPKPSEDTSQTEEVVNIQVKTESTIEKEEQADGSCIETEVVTVVETTTVVTVVKEEFVETIKKGMDQVEAPMIVVTQEINTEIEPSADVKSEECVSAEKEAEKEEIETVIEIEVQKEETPTADVVQTPDITQKGEDKSVESVHCEQKASDTAKTAEILTTVDNEIKVETAEPEKKPDETKEGDKLVEDNKETISKPEESSQQAGIAVQVVLESNDDCSQESTL